MERKAVSFEQLSDIIGFRVIVDTVPDCYAALGVVHSTWPAVPGRFKDYMSTPKQNDYRSIHTTVIGPGQQRVELQIRTAEMDRVAEYGIAAHALYKDGVPVKPKANGGGIGHAAPGGNDEIQAYEWLRRTIELLAEGDTPEEFLEHTKLELFQDQVFCFTPKGRLIALPRRATPIDFAYAVHTDIGDTCVGAKINGRTMPLMTELHNGDEVEIIRSKAQVPPAAWESMVVTGKARSAIRRATRAAVRRQYAGLGRRILERAFERARRPLSDGLLVAGPVAPRAEQYRGHARGSRPRRDPVGQRGQGGLSRPQGGAAIAARPEERGGLVRPPPRRTEVPRAGLLAEDAARAGRLRPRDSDPRPDRRHAGPLRRRRRVAGRAHRRHRHAGARASPSIPIGSQALKAFDDQPERWLDVRWDVEEVKSERFPARIEVTAMNEPGTLAQIAQVIADSGANISNLKITKAAPDFSVMVIDVEVFDVKHLTRLHRAAPGEAGGQLGGAGQCLKRRMTEAEVIATFREADAILEGHFILTSGLRSPVFLQKARVFMYPDKTERLCRALAAKVRAAGLGRSTSSFRRRSAASSRATRRRGSSASGRCGSSARRAVFRLRRFDMPKGARVLIVEDIVTTGLSIRETIEAVRGLGAEVVAAACLIDRSAGEADIGVPLIALANYKVPAYPRRPAPAGTRGNSAGEAGQPRAGVTTVAR